MTSTGPSTPEGPRPTPEKASVESAPDAVVLSPPPQRRARNRTGRARAAVIALAAAGLVLGASRVGGQVQLTPASERAGLPVASDVLVDSAALVCPGQQRLGAQGMRDVSGTVRVATAAAPPQALTALPRPAKDRGLVAVMTTPGGPAVSTTERFRAATTEGSGAGYLLARGTGALAPGLAATQSWLRTHDDDRGLAVTPCTQPTADLWLIGGGAGPSRTERVVIANPGANAVTVRLEVHGAEGPVDSSGETFTVPPRSRHTVSLDAIAPDELRPAVHVVATGGVVTAVLSDAWIEGATARGLEDATGAAAPARDLVVAGVEPAPAGLGETVLRVVNPSSGEAIARVTVLSSSGPRQPPELRAVRVAAGATLDVPLTLPGATTGLHITADQDVAAAVLVDRRQASGADREGDFGWAPAMPPLAATGGAVLPALGQPDNTRTLHLAAGPGGGTVTTTFGVGREERVVVTTLAPQSTAVLPFGGADRVWVSTTATDIRATVTVGFSLKGVPYYSVVPIPSAPTMETSLSVRQVSN